MRPKATRGRPGRPRKSQPKAITITSGPEIAAVDVFSVTDSSVASGSQTLGNAIDDCLLFIIYLFYIFLSLIVDNSIPTFDHPMGTRNFLKKRKSEVINSESTLENKSSFGSFGVCRERRIRFQPIS